MLWQKSESLEIGLSELDRTIIFRGVLAPEITCLYYRN